MTAARWLCWMLAFALAGCARQTVLPDHNPALELPMQLHVTRRTPTEVSDWFLVIQQEGPTLRWSLLDPLGVPLSRQRLQDGRWHADGLLPPNAEAQELFAALLFALTPDDQLAQRYPGRAWHQLGTRRTLQAGTRTIWQVRYGPGNHIDLDAGPALTYGVAPIDAPAGTNTP
jgi:hypothetical protein